MFANALAPSARHALGSLSAAGATRSLYLAGGTAVALQLGHRISQDLDFLAERIDPDRLRAQTELDPGLQECMLICMQNGTTIRIDLRTHQRLKALAAQSGEPLTTILERAVELYRRQQILEETNRAFAGLRDNPKAWEQELSERTAWESTLADGLEED